MPYDPSRHGPRRIVGKGFHGKVRGLVKQVPVGRVTTYGDVAEALGSRTVARQVGFAMAAIDDDGVHVTTLEGPTLAQDFLRMIEDYVERMPRA